MMGNVIYCAKIPPAFWIWFEELRQKYKYATIEFNNGQIILCRVRAPVSDQDMICGMTFGKLVFDDSGICLERTFVPRYYAAEDVVRTSNDVLTPKR